MIRPVILASCLVKKDNKYLLVQEATDKIIVGINTHSKGKWTTPHGEVDKGEKIRTAAERELLEEAGGKTNIEGLVAVATGVLDSTIYIISFVFYGKGFQELGERWTEEIKKVSWFTRKEIKDLEKKGLTRDNVPVSKFIDAVENESGVTFIEWEHPEHVREIFKRMDKVSADFSKKSA